MKILHVVYTPRYSGAEILVMRMATEQVRMGHVVHVLSINPCELDFLQEVRAQAECGIRWISPDTDLGRIARLRFMASKVRMVEPDIIYAHSMIPSLYARAIAPSLTVPVLHSQQNFQERKFFWLEKILSRLTRGVISVSSVALAEYKAHFPEVISTLIENGISVDEFTRFRPVTRSVGAPYRLVHVGRVSRVKRSHLIIELVACLRDLNVPVTASLVGIFEDSYYHQEILELANQRRVTEFVQFLGSRRDIPDLLACADCFVLPSANEAQCIALIEALASGVPVLASDIPGNAFAKDIPGVVLSSFEDIRATAIACRDLLISGERFSRDMSAFDVSVKAQAYVEFAELALGLQSSAGAAV